MLVTAQELLIQFSTLFAVNFAAIFILAYFLYYKRYHDKKSFTTYILFNIFLFTVVFFLIRNSAVVSLWFAMFGILSLIRLRSDTFTKVEITYFFISMSIALLNAMVWSEHMMIMIWVNSVLIFMVYIIDHPVLFQHSLERIQYTLDSVPATLLSQPDETKTHLSKILKVEVTAYEVIEINSIKDSSELLVTYRK